MITQFNSNSRELIVLSGQVENWQGLLSIISRDFSFIVLDDSTDGLTQIADAVAFYGNQGDDDKLSAIHILSPTSLGALSLGSTSLDNSNVGSFSTQLATIGNALSSYGDILLYGSLGTGAEGGQLINQIATLSGADVAVSTIATNTTSAQLAMAAGTIETHPVNLPFAIAAPQPAPSLITGTSGDDTLLGSLSNDTIMGGGGNDVIYGYGGNDYLDGGAGVNTIYGGTGDDVILNAQTEVGEDGNDTLMGDDNINQLVGGNGNDYLYGAGGNDFLQGDAGNDLLAGGLGDDQLSGGADNDRLYGDDGNDILSGGAGADYLEGGLGDDQLDGGQGNDTLIGGDGNDLITDSDGSNIIDGGAGNDVIQVVNYAGGTNTVTTGSGQDTVKLFSGDTATLVITDFTTGSTGDILDVSDLLAANIGYTSGNPFGVSVGYLKLVQDGTDVLLQWDKDGAAGSSFNFKTVLRMQHTSVNSFVAANFSPAISPDGLAFSQNITGTAANETLLGSVINDVIYGMGGNDVIYGYGGDDYLDGGDGINTLYGGAGNDTLLNAQTQFGEDGNDTLIGDNGINQLLGGNGNDVINGAGGNDLLWGDAGNDVIHGDAGDDEVHGGNDSDMLYGDDGNDTLSGDNGNDTLNGGAGDDHLDGGAGDDVLNGGDGNDTITDSYGSNTVDGGAGNDLIQLVSSAGGLNTATGGAGQDTFTIYSSSSAPLTITDFAAGSGGDVLDVTSLLTAFVGYSSGNPFNASVGYLKLLQDGGDVLLQWDKDGAGGTSFNFKTVVRMQNTTVSAFTIDNFSPALSPDGTAVSINITGTAADETLYGGFVNDVINGMGGNDVIYGYGGDDNLDGGDGANTIYGGSGNDIIANAQTGYGDDGNDTLSGNDIGNQLLGGNGNDTLSGFGGNDILWGDAGNDTVYGGLGDDEIHGGNDNDALYGEDGNDNISGDSGNDTLYGGAGNDQLDGGLGDDVIDGGDGNDTITDAYGNNTVYGGAGNDLIQLLGYSGGTDTVDGGAGRDTIQLYSRNTATLNIVNFETGRLGDILDVSDLLASSVGYTSGNPLDATLGFISLAQDGADTLIQWDKDGAAGNSYTAKTVARLVNIDNTALTARNFTPNLKTATDHAPELVGAVVLADGIEDTSYTFKASDLLKAFDDADNDALSVSGITADGGDVVDNGNGTFTLYSYQDLNGIVNFSFNVVDNRGGAVAATQSLYLTPVEDAPLGDVLITGTLADYQIVSADTSIIYDPDGMSGLFNYQWMADGVAINNAIDRDYQLTAAEIGKAITVQVSYVDNGGTTETLTSAASALVQISTTPTPVDDTLTGTNGNDTLSSLAGNDTLYGLAGNDLLDGGTGDDKMYGGSGNDTYIVDSLNDVVSEANNTGFNINPALSTNTDLVKSSVSWSLGQFIENLTLTGLDSIDGTGNELGNVITGNSGNNTLIGGAGDDVLTGGNGKDLLMGGLGNDRFVFNATTESRNSPTTSDAILDFTHTEIEKDIIDLRLIDANPNIAGDQAFTFIGSAAFNAIGQARFAGGILLLNTDSNFGTAEMGVAVTLVGATALVASDFLL